MNSNRSSQRTGAFTLVELLAVIAIIGILAALLLPALNQSQLRVKRIDCESHLHQLGIAFQSFAHDHNDKFPMAVPMTEGGSQEFVRNGYAVGGEFYFSFRQFQVLSNELGAPGVLVCPTDPRIRATDFGMLQNSNLSFFIGVKAGYSKPDSILAGDRNLTANAYPNPSILSLEANNRLWWTRELHLFKGNVLFVGGQVEEWNDATLAANIGNQPVGTDLFMPTVPPDPHAAASGTSGYQNYYGGNPGGGTPPPAILPAPTPASAPPPTYPADNSPGTQGGFSQNPPGHPGTHNQPEVARKNPPATFSTNAPGSGTVTTNETDSTTLTFDQRVVKTMRRIILWTYLLLLLLFLALLAFKSRQWSQERRK
jgi:prepilin-type N-terminal cleavage/methylation domain-containing protein